MMRDDLMVQQEEFGLDNVQKVAYTNNNSSNMVEAH